MAGNWLGATIGNFGGRAITDIILFLVERHAVDWLGENIVAVNSIMSVTVAGSLKGLVGGIITGVIQWLALRLKVPRVRGWILACVIGSLFEGGFRSFALNIFGVVNGPIIRSTIALIGLLATLLAPAFIAGVFTGLLQWLVLHGKVRRAGWWVVVVCVEGLTAASIYFAGIVAPTSRFLAVNDPLSAAVWAIIFGFLTGIPLTWLLRERVQGEQMPMAKPETPN